MMFVDAQGFCKGKLFLIRELSIKSENFNLTYNVDPELNWELMSELDYMTNRFCVDKVHGLSLRPRKKYISQQDAIGLLRQMQLRCKEPLFVKNNQLANILKENNISYCEIDAPKISDMYVTYKNYLPECKNHYKAYENCAKRKVIALYEWYIENQRINDIIKDAVEV